MSWINEATVTTADDKLEAHRAQAVDRINQARDVALASGFEYMGHQFDSDRTSMQRITAAVVLAGRNPDYTTAWITQDNQTVQLDNDAVIGLGMAAEAHERQQVFKARQLKDAIVSASTMGEIDATVW